MLCSYGTDSNPILLEKVNCDNDNYLTILQCSFDAQIPIGIVNKNTHDATVYCCMLYFYTSL